MSHDEKSDNSLQARCTVLDCEWSISVDATNVRRFATLTSSHLDQHIARPNPKHDVDIFRGVAYADDRATKLTAQEIAHRNLFWQFQESPLPSEREIVGNLFSIHKVESNRNAWFKGSKVSEYPQAIYREDDGRAKAHKTTPLHKIDYPEAVAEIDRNTEKGNSALYRTRKLWLVADAWDTSQARADTDVIIDATLDYMQGRYPFPRFLYFPLKITGFDNVITGEIITVGDWHRIKDGDIDAYDGGKIKRHPTARCQMHKSASRVRSTKARGAYALLWCRKGDHYMGKVISGYQIATSIEPVHLTGLRHALEDVEVKHPYQDVGGYNPSDDDNA